MSDLYLQSVLSRYSPTLEFKSAAARTIQPIEFIIRNWSLQYLRKIQLSGSLAKGTSVTGGTDIDIFISLQPTTPSTMQEIYHTLANAMQQSGYQTRLQTVSIGITYNGCKIDLVPGRQQEGSGEYHTLYNRKSAGGWIQTNIQKHINDVSQSGRINEIKLIKIWRNKFSLDFPSFYLELVVMRALAGKPIGQLSNNVLTVLQFIRDQLATARIMDPANTNNVISEELNAAEKNKLALFARDSLNCTEWARIIS